MVCFVASLKKTGMRQIDWLLTRGKRKRGTRTRRMIRLRLYLSARDATCVLRNLSALAVVTNGTAVATVRYLYIYFSIFSFRLEFS